MHVLPTTDEPICTQHEQALQNHIDLPESELAGFKDAGNSMKTTLKGRLRNTHLPYSHALTPLFEATVNSLHSIEDDAKATGRPVRKHRIEIELHRSPQLGFQLGRNAQSNERIVGFRITDDGIGFTEANWQSFGTLDSLEKVSRGCKGIGRLTWLKAFSRVTVQSSFCDDGRWHRREFVFDAQNGIHGAVLATTDASETLTTIELLGFDQRYAESAPKSVDRIAVAILEHCLWFFVREEGVPTMTLRDREEVVNLDDLYDQHMLGTNYGESLEIKGVEFQLTHVKFRQTINKTHVINYCAAGRVVKSESLKDKKVPGFASTLRDQDGSFTYAVYVTSAYLSERASPLRTDFDITDTTSDLFADIEVSFDEIRRSVIARVQEFLTDAIKTNLVACEERVEAFVSTASPSYRPILKHINTSELPIDPEMTDFQLSTLFNRERLKLQENLHSEWNEVLNAVNVQSEEEYRELLGGYLKRVEDLQKSELADYVLHRRVIIDLLSKAIMRDDVGKFARESLLHDLIVPMGVTSDDPKFKRNNLWLLDERLAFHNYLASDIPIASMPVSSSDSRTEPDIAALQLFDMPLAVTESINGPHGALTVVEIKRPMRNDYQGAEDKDPLEQALSYLKKLREGARTKTGRPIPNAENIPGFIYIVADITPTLVDWCEFLRLKPTADGMGYFGFHDGKNYNAYIQVISFDGLLQAAKERNRAFFDALNLPA